MQIEIYDIGRFQLEKFPLSYTRLSYDAELHARYDFLRAIELELNWVRAIERELNALNYHRVFAFVDDVIVVDDVVDNDIVVDHVVDDVVFADNVFEDDVVDYSDESDLSTIYLSSDSCSSDSD